MYNVITKYAVTQEWYFYRVTKRDTYYSSYNYNIIFCSVSLAL